MTDAYGTVVWAADYKPFGEATITASAITNNLRFPGQYFDAETGLHYNYMRDYDPAIGNYIEADPIGNEDGMNHLYVYVTSNPLRAIDPEGLECQEITQAEGITIVEKAKGWLNVPYKWDGASRSGIDCSHLVREVYSQAGYSYANQSEEISSGLFEDKLVTTGKFVKVTGGCQEGDVVLFKSHMGIYTNGRMISARSGLGKVQYSGFSGYGPRKGCYRYKQCKQSDCKK
jgi:RHS repeat-associated protein